jgi:hypothetical protein
MGKGLTGGCLCGAVRWEADVEPTMMGICHCRDCQRATGSAYFPALAVALAALRVTGEPRTFATTAESGRTVTRAFCGACGSLLWGWNTGLPEVRNVSAASLDDPSRFAPMAHVFTASAQPWDPVPPEALRFERMPPE